jgi:hypothetical protein
MSQFNYASGATCLSLSASASQASTVTGSAVDLLDYEGGVAIIQNHGTGTGTLDGKIQDSADGSTGWADVSGATFSQSTTTADCKVLAINPKQIKRYIRYVGTIVTGPQNVAVTLVGMKKSV